MELGLFCRMDALNVTNDEIARVRESFDKNQQAIEQDVEILKKWLQQQPHLPSKAATDDGFLERILLRNKFRIEQAKTKLDNYYTVRGLHREVYHESGNSEMGPSSQIAFFLPLPKLTADLKRLFLWKLEVTDPSRFIYAEMVSQYVHVMEIVMREDYSCGDLILMDFQGVTLEHCLKMSVAELTTAMDIYFKAYSGRMAGVYMFNVPSYINVLLATMKVVLPAKVFERVKTFKDLDSVHGCLDKKLLPKDYGGDTGTIEEIKNKWDKVFESYGEFFDANYFNVSNEKLRVGPVAYNQNFGVDGTFRKLNLD